MWSSSDVCVRNAMKLVRTYRTIFRTKNSKSETLRLRLFRPGLTLKRLIGSVRTSFSSWCRRRAPPNLNLLRSSTRYPRTTRKSQHLPRTPRSSQMTLKRKSALLRQI